MSSPFSPDPLDPIDLDIDGFLINGPLHFLAPPHPLDDRLRNDAGIISLELGGGGKSVPTFTDLAQAEQFIETRPDVAYDCVSLTCRNNFELKSVLVQLALRGDYALGVDPDVRAKARLILIARLLDLLG